MEINTYKKVAGDYTIQTKELDGKKHLVVPVVMMVEGVHNGSRGPLFHSIEELGKIPASWNGIPVTVTHPQKDENYISANSPEIPIVGRVYNTYAEDGKLKGEVWIDEAKIKKISPTALAYIMQGRALDVSVGVFTDEEPTSGEWNGEVYTAIALNHRPDHLALLPGESGACSWADGCGIRVNKVVTNQEQTNDTMTVSEEDVVITEDHGKVENENSNININQQTEVKMADMSKKTPCCLAKIEQLIAHKGTAFTSDDTAWLLEQDEAMLDKLFPAEQQTAAPQVNAAEALNVLRESLRKPEDFINILPTEMQDQMRSGLALHKAKRADLVARITNNSVDKAFTAEELSNMDTAFLEKLDRSIAAPVDYSAQGPAYQANVRNDEDILLPAGVKIS